jgi:hypothetical protein
MTLSENHTSKIFPPTACSRHFQRSKCSLRHPSLPPPQSQTQTFFTVLCARPRFEPIQNKRYSYTCNMFHFPSINQNHNTHTHTHTHTYIYIYIYIYINNQRNTLQCLYYISFSAFSPTRFGRYCCHLQCDVNITTMQRY